MTFHNFFLNLLRLEGKAHHILASRDSLENMNISSAVLGMEPSKHKIIRCSENEVEPEVLHSGVQQIHSLQEFHTTKMESKKILDAQGVHSLVMGCSTQIDHPVILRV